MATKETRSHRIGFMSHFADNIPIIQSGTSDGNGKSDDSTSIMIKIAQ
jgi:hypothetical protein